MKELLFKIKWTNDMSNVPKAEVDPTLFGYEIVYVHLNNNNISPSAHFASIQDDGHLYNILHRYQVM